MTEIRSDRDERVELLHAAIHVATACHRDQVDLQGVPYILHPLRVMGTVATLDEKIIAVLHDVLEDCGEVGRKAVELLNLPPPLTAALDAITRHKGPGLPREPDSEYLARCKADPIARVVKIADMRDNLRGSDERFQSLKRRYRVGIAYLEREGA
jgi:(p)ppGpp synthase/HD superfamily hydrolase